MPQTGYTPIQIYSSSTPTNAPSAGNLTNDTKGSELAINIADKNLFFKDSSNIVNTVPIRQSGTSSNGWLSSTDWNTFNNKQPAGTYVTSVTGTAPVVSSGGTTPAISMAAATTSVNGYLTSTDWNTFNGKQAALVSGTNIKTVSGTTLLGSGDLGTIGTGYGGTGLTSFTANGILYASSTSALATSSNFTYDGTNAALVGSNSSTTFGVGPSLTLQNTYGSAFGAGAPLLFGGPSTSILAGIKGIYTTYGSTYGGSLIFGTNAGNGTGLVEKMRIFASGGVAIGNTTDPGATNLSVTGYAGAASFRPTSSTVPTNGMYLSGTNILAWATNSTNGATLTASQAFLVGTTNDYALGSFTTGYIFAKNGYIWAQDNTGSSSNRNWAAGVNGYAAGSWQLTSSSANNSWPNDAYRFAVTIAGSCYNTTGTYGTLSDERFKENVEDARGYADDLMKVRVVKYSLKEEESDVATKLGVIAQELEQIFPGMIDIGLTPNGDEFKSVKMTVFIPMLLKAFQEQQVVIEQIKQKVGL